MSAMVHGRKWYCVVGYGAGVSPGGTSFIAVDLTRYNGPNILLVEGEGRPVEQIPTPEHAQELPERIVVLPQRRLHARRGREGAPRLLRRASERRAALLRGGRERGSRREARCRLAKCTARTAPTKPARARCSRFGLVAFGFACGRLSVSAIVSFRALAAPLIKL